MEARGKHNNAIGFYCLSFLIPAVIILIALAGLKVVPFGDKTLLISDGNSLYINYLGYVGRALRGGESLLFSFEKGLGGNMMGSWGWFLLNPLFVFFAFFDTVNYPLAFTLVSTLCLSVCGLTMYILLKDLYGHALSNLMFSTAYALNGFLVANVFQMNFFACIPALPIMVLGLRRILADRSPLIYICALGYALLMNFYFGFMLCAASLLIFLTFFLARRAQLPRPKAVVFKYLLASLLAGALAAAVWLPALLSLRGGRLDQSVTGYITIRENMPFLDMASKLFIGANDVDELKDGLPNIFVGLLPVALTVMFFMSSHADRRKKTVAAVLLGVYLLSFYLVFFNLLMHGGTATNWFNYRDSFVFSFLLLMVAAEEWQHVAEEPVRNWKRTGVILGLGTLLVFFKRYAYVSGGEALLSFVILAAMGLAFRMHRRDPAKNPARTLEAVVLVLLCLELFLNYSLSTKKILVMAPANSDYQAVVAPVSELVDAARSDGDLFRMEVGTQRTGNCGNDPMLYGYNGVGHGGSDDRNFVREALHTLGIHRFDMRSSYNDGVPAATDSLLGLRYVISKEDLGERKGYEALETRDIWTLYRNPDALPVALLSGADATEVAPGTEDVFDNLNSAWSAISGRQEAVFVEETDIRFSSHNTTDPAEVQWADAAERTAQRDLEKLLAGGSASQRKEDSIEYITEGAAREVPEDKNYIAFTWTAARDGAVYTYNGAAVSEEEGAILPALNYAGYYHAGDTVTGYLPMLSGAVTQAVLEDVAGRFRAAYADADALSALSAAVRSRPVSVTRLADSHLTGEFTAAAGQKLLFTIPYDEGWTCRIDGQPAEIRIAAGLFMAVDVPAGTHSYELRFVPAGLKPGAVIAAAALLATAVYVPLDRRRRRSQ